MQVCILISSEGVFPLLHILTSRGCHWGFCFVLFCLRQGFSVTLEPVLELALQTRLASNSQRSTCHCLLSARIKGVRHHRLAACVFDLSHSDRYKMESQSHFVLHFPDG